jgi:nucleoside-diphosphate-sugar epimerase
VDDVVEAFLRVGAATDVAGEVFNLGATEVLTVLEIAEQIVEVTGRGRVRLVPFPPQYRAIEVGDFQTDFRKIREHLGWIPRTDFRTGLRRTVEFYERYRDIYIEPFQTG